MTYHIRFKPKDSYGFVGDKSFKFTRNFVVDADTLADAVWKAEDRLMMECYRDPAEYQAYVVNS